MLHFDVIAGGLLAVAGGTFVVRARRALALFEHAAHWETVTGVVVRSELKEQTDSDGTSYHAEIHCSYTVANTKYTTSRHTEGGTFEQPEQSARALISAFPVGKPVELKLDPSDPQHAILDSGMPQHMVIIQRVGYVAVLAGICLTIYGLLRPAGN